MKKIHEKSPCCASVIRLFGTRRRQCSACKKTWRVWKKKRGRKKNRLHIETLLQYFDRKLKNTKLQTSTLAARLRSTLEKFNTETPWPKIPDGPLIVVADGLIEYFGKKKYAVYFILVRSIADSRAFILPPYMRLGSEVALGWQEAFAQVPDEVLARICALVCDGHTGLVYLAKAYGWKVQRCHFHLLYNISHYASFGLMNKTDGIGLKIKRLAHVVLYRKEPEAIRLAIMALQKMKQVVTSRKLKSIISGFLRHHEDYRTYLNVPEYFLPTTSNSAEFLNAQIRDLQYRARGFRTPKSLLSWIIGICKYRKSVTCRPKNQPN